MPRRFIQSLGHARTGVRHAVSTQRNIRIHLVMAALVFAFGVYLKLNDYELVALILAISFVLMAEMVNTSVEEVVNLLTPEKKLEAKIAKDVAAGAVLFSSICAIIVGCLIFIPHLIRR
jgi:diacylglycerol kinase (ATP)